MREYYFVRYNEFDCEILLYGFNTDRKSSIVILLYYIPLPILVCIL